MCWTTIGRDPKKRCSSLWSTDQIAALYFNNSHISLRLAELILYKVDQTLSVKINDCCHLAILRTFVSFSLFSQTTNMTDDSKVFCTRVSEYKHLAYISHIKLPGS